LRNGAFSGEVVRLRSIIASGAPSYSYSLNLVEEEFCELRLYRVLRSWGNY
jgi:hypothetical protein